MEYSSEIEDDHRLDLRLLYSFVNKDEIEVIKWCMRKKLLTNKFKCPKCGKDMKLGIRNRTFDKYIWRCRIGSYDIHDFRKSIRSYSWFSESRLKILNILLISYFWIKKAPSDYVKDELSVALTTVLEWFHNCQQICLEICKVESEILGGEGMVVEIHVTNFTSVKNLRYKGINGKWLFIGLEKSSNKYFFRFSNFKNTEEMVSIIKDWILPGSIVMLDYNYFVDKTFNLLKKTQNLTFKNLGKKSSGDCLFTSVKRSIRGSCSNDVFNLHLAEHLWRQSHDNYRSLIKSFFTNITKIYPPQYSDHME